MAPDPAPSALDHIADPGPQGLFQTRFIVNKDGLKTLPTLPFPLPTSALPLNLVFLSCNVFQDSRTEPKENQ